MRDITIIVSEQVLSFALDVADRLLVIEKGSSSTKRTARAMSIPRRSTRYLSV